jgi:L-2-hydroxyglutarate oxidase LhgO
VADFGVAVVGAGVVGLAVAARLGRRPGDVVVLERNDRHGAETSSRNSEVIHAGMYYPTGSLKARLCVEGNRRMYEFCRRHDVPHRRLGKLIVAMGGGETPALESLLERGQANGVRLDHLTGAQARALEPNVPALSAILSPDTGIVSAHGLTDALLQRAREAGAVVQSRAEVVALERAGADWRLTVRGGPRTESITAERVVNAAGLDSDTMASLAGIDVDAAGYRLSYCKGSYFSVPAAKWGLVSRLVYPVPDPVHLGVHVCLGLDGRLRFGPDAEYVGRGRWTYAVDAGRRPEFARAVRHLMPAIAEEDLAPDTSGLQARLQGPGQGFRDFVITEESGRGLPGLVNLVGIDSPGLTSSLAIAAEVERLVA